MMGNTGQSPVTLLDLLANSIVLRQIAPYIPIASLLNLSATSKALRSTIIGRAEPWGYVDLRDVKSAIIDSSPIDIGGVTWRSERMDESLTEDDFYSGPLRGIFSKLHRTGVLRNVQNLILDGLTVPADLVREILAEDRYNVRLLSLRECKNLNQSKLQHVLNYIVRPTRAEGTPKLKALYVFGLKDPALSTVWSSTRVEVSSSRGVLASEGAQIGAEWNQRSSRALSTQVKDDEAILYNCTGRTMKQPLSGWADTLRACNGLIAFDAVLCRGPRHDITKVESKDFLQPAIATVALGPAGCEVCATCPEGSARFGDSPDGALPLLGPPPMHSPSVRAAQFPQSGVGGFPDLILRCEDCLRGRWCEGCNRWWCETCYVDPVSRTRLRTELQQVERRQELGQQGAGHAMIGPEGNNLGPQVKVYSKLCVEHCLVEEMMSGAGSNGMWG